MASPLRFRYSQERWDEERVKYEILKPLQQSIGATSSTPGFLPRGYKSRRFDMDNGDFALFAWNSSGAYWVGNTETPSALWETEKINFNESPDDLSEWVEVILLNELDQKCPWLTEYHNISWFFLPVFFSKDGRETSRLFFRDHGAGFPNASRDEALEFYDEFLGTGVLDPHRYTMASKLGTSQKLDLVRMSSAMSEFSVAKILFDQGYGIEPEAKVKTGHSLDFKVRKNGREFLAEVTRPQKPENRASRTPIEAVEDTVETKARGQLKNNEAVLFVDCSSFEEREWSKLQRKRSHLRLDHTPTVIFRVNPRKKSINGFEVGVREWSKENTSLEM